MLVELIGADKHIEFNGLKQRWECEVSYDKFLNLLVYGYVGEKAIHHRHASLYIELDFAYRPLCVKYRQMIRRQENKVLFLWTRVKIGRAHV